VNTRLFVSDLHLDHSRPRATAAFLHFLESNARQADGLYILGDLFEFWIGDDDDNPHSEVVLDALRRYTARGHRCLLMRGNRDFLLGSGFTQRVGGELLQDPTLTEIHGRRVLLTHGDLLCTDDHRYQRYRRIVNDPVVQRIFLALPRPWRRAAGDVGRRRSRQYTASQAPTIMDVNATAVAAAFAVHDATVLLHGHTHRPGIQHLEVMGRQCTRIVLGDWYEQGSVLTWSADGYSLTTLPFG
jgi:UDP-2,3-diacylglucosamine hydrolase